MRTLSSILITALKRLACETPIQPVFWPGSLEMKGLQPILDEAQRGGFESIALPWSTISALGDDTRSIEGAARQVSLTGLRIAAVYGMDILNHARECCPSQHRQADSAARNSIEIAASLGVETVVLDDCGYNGGLLINASVEWFERIREMTALHRIPWCEAILPIPPKAKFAIESMR